MSKHTFETIKYYLGKDVYIYEDGITVKLIGLCPDGKINDAIIKTKEDVKNKGWSGIGIADLMPILRPLMCNLDDALSFGRVKSLLNNNSMAISNEESITGYFDIFGMPCILPSMADAGIKFNRDNDE